MAKQQTLLEKAKSVTNIRKNHITEEEVELALAWMRDEISMTQATVAIGQDKRQGAMIYSKFCLALREAYRAGLLKITTK